MNAGGCVPCGAALGSPVFAGSAPRELSTPKNASLSGLQVSPIDFAPNTPLKWCRIPSRSNASCERGERGEREIKVKNKRRKEKSQRETEEGRMAAVRKIQGSKGCREGQRRSPRRHRRAPRR